MSLELWQRWWAHERAYLGIYENLYQHCRLEGHPGKRHKKVEQYRKYNPGRGGAAREQWVGGSILAGSIIN